MVDFVVDAIHAIADGDHKSAWGIALFVLGALGFLSVSFWLFLLL